MRACFTVVLLLWVFPAFAASPVGQWIWTEQDRRVFAESQKVLPELRATPWVSTLTAVARSGASPGEVQLDFDCPVRLLPRYAALVKALGQGARRGRSLWITSLYAHVQAAAYGELFRGLVAGHLLQLFDTGDGLRPAQAEEVVRTVEARGVPFQLGLGAFERSPLYRGLWIFPGGQRWLPLVEEKP